MGVGQTVLRTDSVRVKLAPEMLARVEKLADDFGMPTATLCAFAVASWVRTTEQQAQLARMAVLDASRRVGDNLQMSDDQMEKIFGPMVAQIAQQLSTVDCEPTNKVGK